MKVAVNKEDGFKPVTFNITCETPEELFALWYRFSMNYNKVISNSGFNNAITSRQLKVPTGITESGSPNTYPVFAAITEVVGEYLTNLEGK